MILAENGIDHGLMMLGAMHVGVPAVPVSTAYARLSQDYGKLRYIFGLVEPGPGGDPREAALDVDPHRLAPLDQVFEDLVPDPEVIVLGDAAYGVKATDVAHRAGWSRMTAVRNGAIRPVNDIVITRPGPRIVEPAPPVGE